MPVSGDLLKVCFSRHNVVRTRNHSLSTLAGDMLSNNVIFIISEVAEIHLEACSLEDMSNTLPCELHLQLLCLIFSEGMGWTCFLSPFPTAFLHCNAQSISIRTANIYSPVVRYKDCLLLLVVGGNFF